MTTKKKESPTKLTREEKIAETKMQVSAAVMSAAASENFATGMFPDMNLALLIDELNSKIKAVHNGDMQSMEAMLIGQAQALQTIFVSLARRASKQEYLKQYGLYMTLALKAQGQSRATIQALTELKYPKQVAFVKQANISQGHQQINNGASAKPNANYIDDSRAEKNQLQQNELLEVNNGSETMDIRTTQTTIPKDKAMATVAIQHRGKNN